LNEKWQEMLAEYANLIVKVGLNLQPGQILLLRSAGPVEQTAPLVRLVTAAAYRDGAKLVDALWHDDQLNLIRFQKAPRDSFEEFSAWRVEATMNSIRQGGALLTIDASDPNLLAGQDPDLLSTAQRVAGQAFRPVNDAVTRGAVNWSVAAAASQAWAARVFPDLPESEQVNALWQALFAVCRLDQADPIAAWESHIERIAANARYLTAKQFRALRFTSPGTNLTVGLVPGHIWRGGREYTTAGNGFTANLPTEETFTLPHRERVDGTVAASMPLSLMGNLVEDFSLTFEDGRVVGVKARKGEEVLRRLLETDEGAARLGEVALVPASSPIARSGLLFYNSLYDENAASHIALGNSYRIALEGGASMSEAEYATAGGNQSVVHVDFMIGSKVMDVDGLTESSDFEPIMRQGEWMIG
jgi:aminopeptidase